MLEFYNKYVDKAGLELTPVVVQIVNGRHLVVHEDGENYHLYEKTDKVWCNTKDKVKYICIKLDVWPAGIISTLVRYFK